MPSHRFSNKPRIAINLDVDRGKTTNYKLNRAYIQAILAAGGLPLIIPPMKQKEMISMLSSCHGLLLIGGPDYSAASYKESESDKISPVDSEREEFDFRLVKYAIEKTDLAILGICGGMQLLNIHFGGTLVQDIETSFPGLGEEHRSLIKQPHADHPVRLSPGGKLRKIYRTAEIPSVVSSHHQCIKMPGHGLSLEAYANDGIAEGLSLDGYRYVIGVQWHPEQDYKANRKLFHSLIQASTL